MYVTKAKSDTSIITNTRNNPTISDRSITLINGFINATKMSNVKTTTRCAIILFSFRNGLVKAKNTSPNMTGIKAVHEEFSELVYAQSPIPQRTNPFRKLT